MATPYRKYFWQIWRPTRPANSKTLEDIVREYYNSRMEIDGKINGQDDSEMSKVQGKSIKLSTVVHKIKSSLLKTYNLVNRTNYESSEWDMTQVQNALQTESMFRRAVEKYVEQIWKNGFEFIGQDPKTVEYIRQRFAQMTQVTGKTTLELFQEIGFSLATFAQAIIIRQRNTAASGGRAYTTFDGKRRIPVAGYRVADPTTMYVDRDEFGNVRRWKQYMTTGDFIMSSKAPEWPSYNVIHIQDRTATSPKYFFAMPMVVPVIPDIQALRETEELAILQALKFSLPKYHAKVGERDKPGTQAEIDSTINLLSSLPTDGVLVTSSRIALENVSKNDSVMDMEPLKSYWRDRILAGLGMSDIAMGKGDSSSRATAQVLSIEMQSTTIKFQQIIKAGIEEHMIKELLFEAGYRPETIKEHMVYLRIPEIDLEQKIKREAHTLQKWTTNCITQDELRKELGYDIMTDEQQKQLYLYMVQIPLVEAEAKAKSLLTTVNNSVSNTNQPTNQHGKSLAKPRISKDSYDELYTKLTSPDIETAEQAIDVVNSVNNIDSPAKELIIRHLSFAYMSDTDELLSVPYISKVILDTLKHYMTIESTTNE